MSKVEFVEMPYSGAAAIWEPEWHSKDLFSWHEVPHPKLRTHNCDPMRGKAKFKWPKYLLQKEKEQWVVYAYLFGEVSELARLDGLEECKDFCSKREAERDAEAFIEDLITDWMEQERKDDSR